MARLTVIFLFALLALPVAFADVGPSPPAPDVRVSLQKGDGTPDLRIALVTYHCMGSNSTSNGAVDERLADLPCAGGECRNNGGWFYKFNPCYNFPEGYFSYELNGKAVSTDYFNNTQQYGSYAMVVDSESGGIKSSGGNGFPAPCCPPALGLALLGAAAFAARE